MRTIPVKDVETDRVVSFCGMVLQRPSLAMRRTMPKHPSEIYIGTIESRSPAQLEGVLPSAFITHVNDRQVSDIDNFVNVIKHVSDNVPFWLRTTYFLGGEFVNQLKRCDNYFPLKIYKIVDGK